MVRGYAGPAAASLSIWHLQLIRQHRQPWLNADTDTLQLGMNCLVSVTLLVLSELHHIIPAQECSMPYGTCVYTTKTDGQ